MEIQKNISLKPFNTFHVEAAASSFIQLQSPKQIPQAVDYAQTKNLPILILGQGSNILFTQDYSGLVINLGFDDISYQQVNENVTRVTAEAGASWHRLVLDTLKHDCFGLENLTLIPGSVGAAPVQNIGAYGVELKDSLVDVSVYDTQDKKFKTLSADECQFGYRDSVFKSQAKGRYIIIAVTFHLSGKPDINIEYQSLKEYLQASDMQHISPTQVSAAVAAVRQARLPDPAVTGNAGSFFRNPEIDPMHFQSLQQTWPDIPGRESGGKVKLSSAWLIENAGWKGYCNDDACVSEQHALVLINKGNASGREIYQLAMEVRAGVNEKFGVELEPEVTIY